MKTFYESELKELAGKRFESVKELEKAEAEVSEQIAAKQKAVEVRKADAEVVKTAIVKATEVKAKVKEAKLEAYKTYLAELDKLDKELSDVESEQSKALTEFCKKHPEGFHDTIKIGDVEYTYDYNTQTNPVSLLDVFTKFWF